jgi:aerobic carbon-monoxide dehydrogenase large subunit
MARAWRCRNALIVHGQTHGGAAQGVGQAMWEECALDPDSGRPLCGSFMDYGMPRSDNLPCFATEIVEVLSPTIKAGGEGGCTPALAVVVGAILDAFAPLGVHDNTMPAIPFKVWQAIPDARVISAEASCYAGLTIRRPALPPAIHAIRHRAVPAGAATRQSSPVGAR